MNSKFYKCCAVPQCSSTTIKTPEKLFIYVPRSVKSRNMWLRLARRDPALLSTQSKMYFCEDHFDLPHDMENYTEYRLMGSVSRVRMKTGCLPLKFECQPDRKRRTHNETTRPLAIKRQRLEIIAECEREIEKARNISVAEASQSISLAEVQPGPSSDRLVAKVCKKAPLLCQTCLSDKRILLPIEDMKQLIHEVGMPEITEMEGGMCWECVAILKKTLQFKKQVSSAQQTLLGAKKKKKPKLSTLSTLKLCIQENIDITSEVENKDVYLVERVPINESNDINLEADVEILKEYENTQNTEQHTQRITETNKNTNSVNYNADMRMEILKHINIIKEILFPQTQNEVVNVRTKQTDRDCSVKHWLDNNCEVDDNEPLDPKSCKQNRTTHIQSNINAVNTVETGKVNIENVNLIVNKKMETYMNIIKAKLDRGSSQKQSNRDEAGEQRSLGKSVLSIEAMELESTNSTSTIDLDTAKTNDVIELNSDDEIKMEIDNINTKNADTYDVQCLTKVKNEEVQQKEGCQEPVTKQCNKTMVGIKIQRISKDDDKFTRILLNEDDMLADRQERLQNINYTKYAYKCQYCIIGFQNIEKYIQHLRSKHSQAGEYMCNICQSAYTTRTYLQAHVTSHYVLYRCAQCDFDTHRRKDMLAHCDTHDI